VNELRGTKIKLRDFNLSTRITLSAVLLVFVSGLLWVAYQNNLQKQVHFHEQLEEANLALQRQSVDLERTIANLQQDVVFLAKVPPISGMIRARENSGFDPVDKNDYATWERRLQEIFTGFLEAHPEYAQARFISVADEGKVLVKVQHHEGQIEIIPHQMLQGMSNSSFFKAGLTLHNGEVHLSEISLEKDGNHIEVPHRPTLRAVTPVFGSDGNVFGMVVINLDIQPLLKDSMASIPERFKGYIANQQGYYLFHPDSKREYEFEFGGKSNISNDFPKLKSIFGTQTPSIVKLQPSGDKLNGYVAAKRIFFDTKDHAQFLVLAYYLSQQELKSPFVQLSLFELFKAILIATIFAGIFRFLLRRTFTPLKRITLAAQEIAAGNHSLRLTESGKDEIGQLSLALNNMLDELSDHERIKKENEFRRAITETAHDGYWLVDTQGYLLEVNQAYADTFGYTVDELVGMHVSQLEAKELSADEVNAHLKKIIEQGNDFLNRNIDIRMGAYLTLKFPLLLYQKRNKRLHLSTILLGASKLKPP
jgi:PAS domain S-box-containing protein